MSSVPPAPDEATPMLIGQDGSIFTNVGRVIQSVELTLSISIRSEYHMGHAPPSSTALPSVQVALVEALATSPESQKKSLFGNLPTLTW